MFSTNIVLAQIKDKRVHFISKCSNQKNNMLYIYIIFLNTH